jgi:hypothetical protein
MVAVIHTSSSLRAVLTYNERKVAQRSKPCVWRRKITRKEAADLTFNQKLNLLRKASFAEPADKG